MYKVHSFIIIYVLIGLQWGIWNNICSVRKHILDFPSAGKRREARVCLRVPVHAV